MAIEGGEYAIAKIDNMTPGTGRRLKEDSTTVNIADKIEAIAEALDLSTLATKDNQDAQTSALNDILEQLEIGNAPNILRNTGKNPPVGVILGAAGTYESDSIDRPNQNIPVGQTRVWVYADQSGTLNLRESHNGTNWTTTNSLSISAGITNIMNWFKLTRRYAKIEYVNGGVAQTEFIVLQYFLGVGVTIIKAEDGDIVSIGSKADAAVTDPTLSGSEIALLKGLLTKINTIIDGTTPATTVLTAGNNFVGTVSISPESDGNILQVNSDGSINAQLIGTDPNSGSSVQQSIVDMEGFGVAPVQIRGSNQVGGTMDASVVDVDTDAENIHGAVSVSWRKSGVGAPEFGTDANPVAIKLTGSIPSGNNTVGNIGINAGSNLIGKTANNFQERVFNLIVGAGATVTSDTYQLEGRKLVGIFITTGTGTTYTLRIRYLKANEAAPYGQTDVVTSKTGANSFDVYTTGWEASFYRLAITDIGGAGFTATINLKERD